MPYKDHLPTKVELDRRNRRQGTRSNSSLFQAVPPTISGSSNRVGQQQPTTATTERTGFPILFEIDDRSDNHDAVVNIDLSQSNAHYHVVQISDKDADDNDIEEVQINFLNAVKDRDIEFVLILINNPDNENQPTVSFAPHLVGLPAGFPNAFEYVFKVAFAFRDEGARYDILNRGAAGGGSPTVLDNLNENNIGEIGDITQIINWEEANFHRFVATGDVNIAFNNPPDMGKWQEIILEITQDDDGDHDITFGNTIVNGTPVIDTDADAVTRLRFYHRAGVYAWAPWFASGGSGLLSELTIDTSKDWAGQSISNLQNLSLSADGLATLRNVDFMTWGNDDYTITALPRTGDPPDDTSPAIVFDTRDNLSLWRFRLGASTKMEIGVNEVDFYEGINLNSTTANSNDILGVGSLHTNNIILSNSFIINASTLMPSNNGEFTRVGDDVMVYTGDKVVNLSDGLITDRIVDGQTSVVADNMNGSVTIRVVNDDTDPPSSPIIMNIGDSFIQLRATLNTDSDINMGGDLDLNGGTIEDVNTLSFDGATSRLDQLLTLAFHTDTTAVGGLITGLRNIGFYGADQTIASDPTNLRILYSVGATSRHTFVNGTTTPLSIHTNGVTVYDLIWTASPIGRTVNQINMTNIGNDLLMTLPSASSFEIFYGSGDSVWEFTSSLFSGPLATFENLIITETISLHDHEADPGSANGSIVLNGDDVLVRSGGNIVNLSNSGGGGAGDRISNDTSSVVVSGDGAAGRVLTTIGGDATAQISAQGLNMLAHPISGVTMITFSSIQFITSTAAALTIGLLNDDDLIFTEGGSEVGRFDGGQNQWRFNRIIDMRDNRISNLGAPLLDDDAATKEYVDDNGGGGGARDRIEDGNDSVIVDNNQIAMRINGNAIWSLAATQLTITPTVSIGGLLNLTGALSVFGNTTLRGADVLIDPTDDIILRAGGGSSNEINLTGGIITIQSQASSVTLTAGGANADLNLFAARDVHLQPGNNRYVDIGGPTGSAPSGNPVGRIQVEINGVPYSLAYYTA